MTDAGLARAGLAFVFFYQGLVPKLLGPAPVERALIASHGLGDRAGLVASAAGVAEIALAVALVALPRRRWPVVVALGALVLLSIDVALMAPELLVAAFNPVTLNAAAIILAILALRGRSAAA